MLWSKATIHEIDKINDLKLESREIAARERLHYLKIDPLRLGLDSLICEAAKLEQLRQLELPDNLFSGISNKVLLLYKQRVAVEPPREIRRHPENRRSNNEIHKPVISALELLKKYSSP